MNKAQLVVLWVVGVSLSAAFFYAGIGEALVVQRSYEIRAARVMKTPGPTPQSEKDVNDLTRVLKDPEASRKERMDAQKKFAVGSASFVSRATARADALDDLERKEREDPRARANYVTGAVVPIAILGLCAFLTASRRPQTSIELTRRES